MSFSCCRDKGTEHHSSAEIARDTTFVPSMGCVAPNFLSQLPYFHFCRPRACILRGELTCKPRLVSRHLPVHPCDGASVIGALIRRAQCGHDRQTIRHAFDVNKSNTCLEVCGLRRTPGIAGRRQNPFIGNEKYYENPLVYATVTLLLIYNENENSLDRGLRPEDRLHQDTTKTPIRDGVAISLTSGFSPS